MSTKPHTAPLWEYLAIFVALLALTGLTVWTALSQIGGWHLPVALAIAVCKAVLVVLFFMHVLHGSRLTWMVLAAAVFMLGVLFVLTFADYLTRQWLTS